MWVQERQESRRPQSGKSRHLGTYALTSNLCLWTANAFNKYQPSDGVLHLIEPFAKEFHNLTDNERKSCFGLHDIDIIEFTYQHALEIGAAILLAADKTDEPVDLSLRLHPSRASMDEPSRLGEDSSLVLSVIRQSSCSSLYIFSCAVLFLSSQSRIIRTRIMCIRP